MRNTHPQRAPTPLFFSLLRFFFLLVICVHTCSFTAFLTVCFATTTHLPGVQGLSEDVSINKFFDDPMLLELARQDVVLGAGF